MNALVFECTVCGGAAKLERRLPEVDTYRCQVCDHCFSDLGRVQTQEAYDSDYYVATHRNWFEHPNLKLFEMIHRAIAAAKEGAAVIDIGCGKGDLLKYLQARDPRYSLTGLDLSPNSAIEGITLLRGDIQSQKFDRTYDAVVCLAAIEHIDDIHGFVLRLRDLCAPGGQVVVMTLNDRSVLYAVARWLAALGWQGPVTRLYDKHHINHFNVGSLNRLLASAGLRVEKTLMHNAPLAAMDFPSSSKLADLVQRVGVWGTFALGSVARATYLQTVVCRRTA